MVDEFTQCLVCGSLSIMKTETNHCIQAKNSLMFENICLVLLSWKNVCSSDIE